MKISVIIPTLNAQGYLAQQLQVLWRQTVAPDEIIVIDSESTDDTRRIAREMGACVMQVRRAEFNHGRTRNIAASQARGDFLVFLTQDALPVDEHLIRELVTPLTTDGVAISYGRQIAYPQARAIEKFVRSFNYPAEGRLKEQRDIEALGVKTFFSSNACAAYRRDVFEALGGFLVDTIMNEDMEYVYRALQQGYKACYAAGARVWHSHDYTLFEQFKRYVDIGVFFADNPKLASLSRNTGEGLRYMRQAARFLIQQRKLDELPRLFGDSLARFIGYRLGVRYRLLPVRWVRRVSMNRTYWEGRQVT